MRRPPATLVVGLALVVFASVAFVTGPAVRPAHAQADLQQQLAQTRAEREAAAKELAALRNQESTARSRFDDARRIHDAAVAELRRIDNELERAQAELGLAIERAEATRREVEQADRDVARAAETLAERRQQFDTRVVAAFKYGQMSLTDVFASVRDVSDLIVTTTFVNAVVQNDRTMVEEMRALLDDLDERRAEAVAMRVEADKARDDAERVEASISARIEEQRAVAAEVQRTRTALAGALSELQNDRQALEEHLAELDAAQRTIERMIREAQARDVGNTGSGWVRPTTGWVSSPFGNRFHPVHRRNILHAGVDLASPTGTPIVASRGGIVRHAGWIGGYGNTVIIDHGAGVTTLYAHMSAFSVGNGQYIAQGGRVGLVGMTGTATGPHLHFEVRIGVVPQNPCGYISC